MSTYIEGFWRGAAFAARLPLALQIFTGRVHSRRGGLRCSGGSGLLRKLALLWDDILWRRRIGSSSAGFAEIRHGREVAKKCCEEQVGRAKIFQQLTWRRRGTRNRSSRRRQGYTTRVQRRRMDLRTTTETVMNGR